MAGLDFHDCNSNKKTPKTSRTEDSEYVTLYSWVEYYCSVCGAHQFTDDHSPTKIAKPREK